MQKTHNKCFNIKRDGRLEFLQWPAGRPIALDNVSRVFEALSNDDALVNHLCAKMDQLLASECTALSGYTGSLATYKGGMTKNRLLRIMRSDLVAFTRFTTETTDAHGKHFRAKSPDEKLVDESEIVRVLRSMITGVEAEPSTAVDRRKSLGGLLEVAWLVHKSEERLNEDRNYGEALLNYGKEILKTFCYNMYSEIFVNQANSTERREFIELYNAAAQKVVEEFVIGLIRARKITADQLRFDNDGIPSQNSYPALNIPKNITESREFIWVAENWRLL